MTNNFDISGVHLPVSLIANCSKWQYCICKYQYNERILGIMFISTYQLLVKVVDSSFLIPQVVVELGDPGVELIDLLFQGGFLCLCPKLGPLTLLDAAP